MSSTTVPLKRTATLAADGATSARPMVSLEHIESWTGALLPGTVLPVAAPDATGVVAVEPGDVLFGKLRPYLAKSWLVKEPAVASTELLCLRSEPSVVDSRWLAYVVISKPFVEFAVATSEGTKMPRSNWEKLGEYPLTPLPVSDQRAIADYLDTETARINALITKKRRLIELLDERWAEATEIATLGLDRGDLAASRSDYFEKLPERWTQTSLRHLECEVQTGPFGSQLHAEEYVEGGYPVVNPANIRAGQITAISSMTISGAKRNDLARHTLREGDIVFGRRGEMGRAGLVTRDEAGWICGTGSLRLRLKSHSPLAPEYLKLLLETKALKSYFTLQSVGSTMDNLNSEILLGLPALVPPAETQRVIIASVHAARSQGCGIKRHLGEQIDLLVEHRQALITAAVTGEFAVPGAAA